jgi:hypothetical protein
MQSLKENHSQFAFLFHLLAEKDKKIHQKLHLPRIKRIFSEKEDMSLRKDQRTAISGGGDLCGFGANLRRPLHQ